MTDMHADLVKWRHHLHAHPELGFEETETSEFIARRLTEMGVATTRGIAGTGLVGIIEGRPGQRGIALRADMDALPIHETTGLSYASRFPNKMHACGHDGHIAMLLGAARHLSATRDFTGTLFLIFQPAEETGGGARVMIEDGLFRKFPIQEVYGLHNWPGIEEGRFALRPGPVMAASDSFDIEIIGRGCHAGMPHQGLDPIAAGAQIVAAVQQLISRRAAPWDCAVVSVTRFHAGDAYNVIPDTARLAGTLRSLNDEQLESLREDFQRVVRNTAKAHGLEAKISMHPGYPVTVNTAAQTAFAAEAAAAVSGKPVLHDLPPSTATEDFAYMLRSKPGCYAWLGSGSGEGGKSLHSPTYDFNDALIPLGVSYWTVLAQRRLADCP
jgi:hippurate hydrolase